MGGVSRYFSQVSGYTMVDWLSRITELILERAGPSIFSHFLPELRAFRLIPVIALQEEQSLKITGNDYWFQTGPIPQKTQ